MKQAQKQPDDNSPRHDMPSLEQYATPLEESAEQPRPNWARRIFKVLGISLLLLLLSAVGYAGYIAVSVAKISTKPFSLEGLAQDAAGRTNILVLGVGDPGHSGAKLSDSLMVLSLDSRTKRVAQISLPRDLRVAIPGHGSAKINAANALGGPDLAAQTVSNTLGIPINYYVQTNFSGLKQMVDAVGGIDVDVKQRLRDTEYPCDDNQYRVCGLVIEPGLQHMDGARALQYARCRKGTCGNDFGRAERQQEVLNLLRDRLANWDLVLNPAKIGIIVRAVQASLNTDMSALQMIEFGVRWQEAKANQPVSLVLSTGKDGYLRNITGTSDLGPVTGDFTVIQQRVSEILN